MESKKIRELYLDFFKSKGHTVVPSASLIPFEDQTILFTNAGMVQFKKYWATEIPLPYKRATSCQKCLRAGGKDSDLEKIGKSGRHHTFFEMLGNFSFGDYFKEEAIEWAYEFVTDILKIPVKVLWVSYYEEDIETKEIWKKFLHKEKIIPLGKKDNFWGPAGDTGPCGPCTELYIDFGEGKSCGRPDCKPGCECGRFLEFWNLVFPQYDMQVDATLLPLKRRGVDTGMGLERIARVLQGKETNYETDLFMPIIEKLQEISGFEYKDKKRDFRIISDHIRAITFLISDNILPSNEGRGYVLRRLIRRGCLSGMNLNLKGPFLYRLSEVVVEIMKDVYPELEKNRSVVRKIVFEEENKFYSIIETSNKIFQIKLKDIKEKIIPGEVAFNLYDTYGVPKDLIEEFSISKGLEVDWQTFEEEMKKRKNLSRTFSSVGFTPKKIFEPSSIIATNFAGYEKTEEKGKIVALYSDDKRKLLSMVLDITPFYPEKGGQIGDKGLIENDLIKFSVVDTQIDERGLIHHIGKLEKGKVEDIKEGMEVKAMVDKEFRKKVSINHTCTHLLHYALRKAFGEEVRQAGSYVGDDKLRFDFVCFSEVNEEKIREIEEIVQEKIFDSSPVKVKEMPLEEVMKMPDIIALFMEKYEKIVRVITIGDYHSEVCGGTHLKNTSDAFLFKIINFSSIGKNLKRIEAITYKEATGYLNNNTEKIKEISSILNTAEEKVVEKIKKLIEEKERKEKLIEKYEEQLLKQMVEEIIKNAKVIKVNGKEIKFVSKIINLERKETLSKIADAVIEKTGTGITIIASKINEKLFVVVKVSKDIADFIPAGKIIKEITPFIKGGGGGSATFAQGSGKDINGFVKGTEHILKFIKKRERNGT